MPDQLPPDDRTIRNEELLYLRVFPDADNIKPLQGGGYRPRSGELRSDEALSVDLGSLCTPEQTRDRDSSLPFHVAEIPAGLARSEGCRIVRDPLENNPAHALLYGNHKSGNGSLSMRQTEKIARAVRIVLLNPAAPMPTNT